MSATPIPTAPLDARRPPDDRAVPIPTAAEARAALAEARAAAVPGWPLTAALLALAAALCALPILAALAAPALRWLSAAPAALGVLMAAIALHEAAHGTLFGRRRLDALAGALASLVTIQPFAAYRRGHAAHHHHAGTPRDPTTAPRDPPPQNRALDLALRLRIPVFYWGGVWAPYLVYDLRPTAAPRRARHLARTALDLAAIALAWTALATLAPAALAPLALAWIGAAILYEHLFTFTHHLGLAPPPGAHHGPRAQTAFARTARLPASTLLFHFDHHKEHHLAPGLPWQRLPALHRALARRRPDVAAFTRDHRCPRPARAHEAMTPHLGDP